MKAVRRLMAALLFGGVFAPLAPHALVHAWGDAHFHRHANGTEHSHHHDADHHENEVAPDSDCGLRLLPSRASAQGDGTMFTLISSAAQIQEGPRLLALTSSSSRSASPPGHRESPHLGRAPPA